MPSNHLILCHPLLLLSSICPSIRVFFSESALPFRWPKYLELQLQHQSFQWTNSCPLSQWCHPTIYSSVIPFSSHLQTFPASGSFPKSQFFASGGQSIGVSASTSVLPMNIQGWFPLTVTGLISLKLKGLSGVFSSTAIWKHQFLSAQPSLWSNSHIHTWLLEKP